MNFLLGKSAEIEIHLDESGARKHVEVKRDGNKVILPVYYDGESVRGKVVFNISKGKKLEHQGIKIEFYGFIDMLFDRSSNYQFISMEQTLARPGILNESHSLNFEFKDVEKQYETYVGLNVHLKYMLKVVVVKRLSDMVKEKEILVQSLSQYAAVNDSLKMEVGIEDCLHIEFEYNKSKYHLNDVIVGKIYFILVRVKIKHMELQIIKQETIGSGPSSYVDNDVVTKYEIMDGAPVRGESIPIRLFLKGFEEHLAPTMLDIGHRFSVKYFLNLVLIDEEDRRYFKQQGIFLYRKSDKKRKQVAATQSNMSVLLKQATAMGFAQPISHASPKEGDNESVNNNNSEPIVSTEENAE